MVNGTFTATLDTTGVLTNTGDITTTTGNLIATTATTASVFNISPTATVNIAGAATSTTIGGIGGTITLQGNVLVSGFTAGYRDKPQIAYLGTTTLAISDGHKHYYSALAGAGTTTLTIPTNATVAFAIGTVVDIVNQGAGSINITRAAGVNLFLAGSGAGGINSDRVLAPNGVVMLIKVATNTWYVAGFGVA